MNELSRNIMADWVPLLESHDLTYEIEIPETEYMTRVDSTAYTRILYFLADKFIFILFVFLHDIPFQAVAFLPHLQMQSSLYLFYFLIHT